MFAIFFAAWVVFSFLAHRIAKYYFQTIAIGDEDPLVLTLQSAVLITVVQLLICGVLSLIKAPADTNKPTVGVLLSAAIPHSFGALATELQHGAHPSKHLRTLSRLQRKLEPMLQFTTTAGWESNLGLWQWAPYLVTISDFYGISGVSRILTRGCSIKIHIANHTHYLLGVYIMFMLIFLLTLQGVVTPIGPVLTTATVVKVRSRVEFRPLLVNGQGVWGQS